MLHLKHRLNSSPELDFFSGVLNYWNLIEVPLPVSRIPADSSEFTFNSTASSQVIPSRRESTRERSGVLGKDTTPTGESPCLWVSTQCQDTRMSQPYFRDRVDSLSEETQGIKTHLNIPHCLLSARQEENPQRRCFSPTGWVQLIYFHGDHSSIRAENINVREAIINVYQ